MTKSELRQIFLVKQKSLSVAARKERSLQITGKFFENFNLESIRFLHVFLAIEQNKEIETSFIYKRLWRDCPRITTVAPRVKIQTMTLESLKFNAGTKLMQNRWHIFEPTGIELIDIKKIDAVLVPLLCFDRRGFRVGYGKGFYDKFLSECRTDCLKIGLSYFAPTAEISDAQSFDVRLDYCLTPEEMYTAEKNDLP